MDKRFLTNLGWGFLAAGLLIYVKSMVYEVLLFSPRNDFGHLYSAGFLADRGGNFFDFEFIRRAAAQNGIPTINPFVYPPFFAMVLIPLSWVSYNTAWLIFNGMSHAAFFLSLWLIIQIFQKKDEPSTLWWGGLVLFSSLFVPLQKNYMAGQMNTFMLLVLTGAYYLYTQKKEIAMGVVLGAGAAIKIAPGFFLLYLLYKKKWKASAALLITLLAAFGLSYTYFGGEIHQDFFGEVRQMSYGSSTWAEHGMKFHIEPHNQAPSAMWYRLLTHNPTTTGLVDSASMAKALSVCTALIVMGLLVLTTRFGVSCTTKEIALWSVGMLWIPSLMWDHYLVQLVLALAASGRILADGKARHSWLWFAGIALMGMDYPYNFDFPPFKSGIMVLFMNMKLYGSVMMALFLIINNDHAETISTTTTLPSSGN